MYPSITEAVHRELDAMEDKFANGVQMTAADLDMFDKMVHSLKCLATYEAMEEGYQRNRPRGRTYYDRRY